MRKKILLLRISYWWGILVDAAAAVLMLFPNLYLRFMNIDLNPDTSFGYGLLNAVPLMAGWTILLFWADRKPVARKDVLPLTILVIVGYIALRVYALVTGLTPLEQFGQTLPLLVNQVAMCALFLFSYLNARTLSEA
jgi:predicted neutral ceramidase superfamily lipid hydrolase